MLTVVVLNTLKLGAVRALNTQTLNDAVGGAIQIAIFGYVRRNIWRETVHKHLEVEVGIRGVQEERPVKRDANHIIGVGLERRAVVREELTRNLLACRWGTIYLEPIISGYVLL
tara:strand:- start:11221 stop:11562 length:342 start_codon:yes stop_codon:yes gene_type:complete